VDEIVEEVMETVDVIVEEVMVIVVVVAVVVIVLVLVAVIVAEVIVEDKVEVDEDVDIVVVVLKSSSSQVSRFTTSSTQATSGRHPDRVVGVTSHVPSEPSKTSHCATTSPPKPSAQTQWPADFL
jgi:hypothetical protein